MVKRDSKCRFVKKNDEMKKAKKNKTHETILGFIEGPEVCREIELYAKIEKQKLEYAKLMTVKDAQDKKIAEQDSRIERLNILISNLQMEKDEAEKAWKETKKKFDAMISAFVISNIVLKKAIWSMWYFNRKRFIKQFDCVLEKLEELMDSDYVIENETYKKYVH